MRSLRSMCRVGAVPISRWASRCRAVTVLQVSRMAMTCGSSPIAAVRSLITSGSTLAVLT